MTRYCNPRLRDQLIRLLRQGRMTRSEAASIAGVRFASVDGWLIRRGIDPLQARDDYLRKLLQENVTDDRLHPILVASPTSPHRFS